MNTSRLANALLLLAVLSVIVSPFGFLLEPLAWVAAAAICLAAAMALRFVGRPRSDVLPSEPKMLPVGLSGLAALRAEKDRFFKNSADSPLLPEQRPAFTRLRYYPPDPAAQFVVVLEEYPEKLKVPIGTSTGGVFDYLRWGEVSFEYRGTPCRLVVFRADPFDENLFVPFADQTSGVTTYGGGRYLELIEDDDGHYLLDFNRAYNPYCAYNAGWSCPLPPVENRLAAAIEAGEKTFEEQH